MTKDEIQEVATAAGKAAAHDTLVAMGIDPTQPFAMQADFAHLRRWRLLVERSFVWVVLSFIGLAATSIWMVAGFPKK